MKKNLINVDAVRTLQGKHAISQMFTTKTNWSKTSDNHASPGIQRKWYSD